MTKRRKSAPRKQSRRKRKRNYAVEYARRMARAKALGFSKTQGRGHPRKNEPKIKDVPRRRVPIETVVEAVAALPVRSPTKFIIDARRDEIKRKSGDLPPGAPVRELPADTIDITDQDSFIELMLALGFSEREAYSKWFSP
jgi:hypothetical protein